MTKKYKLLFSQCGSLTARQCISSDMTGKGCKKCCISTAMDEIDDMLWNGSEEVGNIRSECEDGEVTDCDGRDNDTDW
jgi:hypothetical protein